MSTGHAGSGARPEMSPPLRSHSRRCGASRQAWTFVTVGARAKSTPWFALRRASDLVNQEEVFTAIVQPLNLPTGGLPKVEGLRFSYGVAERWTARPVDDLMSFQRE